jgi:hypothetical protein
MTDLRKAAEQALKYFEDAHGLEDTEVAIKEALREALGESEEIDELCQREWVGLTGKDVHDAFNFTELVKQLSWEREPQEWCENFAAYHTIAYCEAKLKEKNLPEGCA